MTNELLGRIFHAPQHPDQKVREERDIFRKDVRETCVSSRFRDLCTKTFPLFQPPAKASSWLEKWQCIKIHQGLYWPKKNRDFLLLLLFFFFPQSNHERRFSMQIRKWEREKVCSESGGHATERPPLMFYIREIFSEKNLGINGRLLKTMTVQ